MNSSQSVSINERSSAATIITTTEDNDDIDDDDLDIVGYKCDLDNGDLLARYFRSVKHLVKYINRLVVFGYWLEPVLISNRLSSEVECVLPTSVLGVKVKLLVKEDSLFIVELSAGDPHNAGVVNIVGQGSKWNTIMEQRSDGKNVVGGGPNTSSSPDMVVAIPSQFATVGQNMGRVVIVELEISNRNVRQMRSDFAQYFAKPTVHSVLGIKCYGTVECPAKFACAVMWSREPGEEVRVSGVWDFGFLSMRNRHRKLFESQLAGALPSVHPHQWLMSRFTPVASADITPRGELPPEGPAYVESGLNFIQGLWPPQAPLILYPDGRPFAIFSGQMFMSYLHNLPAGAPPLEDFRLDLGELFYSLVRTRRP